MAERKNPLDLSGFTPRPADARSRPAPEIIEQIAEENAFPSRQPASPLAPVSASVVKPGAQPSHAPQPQFPPQDNRRRTGRNVQKNVKLTAQGVADLEEEARLSKETFGEVLERGIAAIRRLREMGVNDYYPKDR
ncbi:hypothetical protein [Burkholderia gladioli]|uniref:hypothetical protein n=1 Tax=Burkholderia gladioli TaxID=28095 RepID=UPI0030167DC6